MAIILLLLEIVNSKHDLLVPFFVVIVGSLLTFTLSDLFDRFFTKLNFKKFWNLIIRNLFYVYLFHDPLNYLVLKVFFASNMLSTDLGCILYVLCRTLIIIAICILLGEAVHRIKEYYKRFSLPTDN